ncbi:DNA mismatch repair protein MSH3 isoform X1 [Tanacetum coccineum]
MASTQEWELLIVSNREVSTFLEELGEASHILQTCTGRSLVILDELGRGTSTHDGVAIAYATLHYLLEQKRCMVLFVTHYPEIVNMTKGFSGGVGSYHVSYLTSQDEDTMNSNRNREGESRDFEDVVYLYKLVPGVSERSFGFKVAQLAQLPLSCINRASAMAMKLEEAVRNRRKNRLAQTISQEMGRNDEIGGAEALKEFKDIFSNLNLAFSEDDDPAKSFQCIQHARNLALELINSGVDMTRCIIRKVSSDEVTPCFSINLGSSVRSLEIIISLSFRSPGCLL